MATQRLRWPIGAETHRRNALACIADARAQQQEAQTLARRARDLIRRRENPALTELILADLATLISDAETASADAQRYLEAARNIEEPS